MTSAPRLMATSEVRSVDPLSTTITWSTNSGMRRSTFSIPCSSFKHGMITVIFCDLYTQASQAIMVVMKVLLFTILTCVLGALAAANSQLQQVRNVYILP